MPSSHWKKDSEPVAPEPEGPSEQERVWGWRQDRLVRSGFDLAAASALAHSTADIHRAEHVVSMGARDPQILEILL